MDAFIGKLPGSIGEVSTLALLIGGAFIVFARIAWRIIVIMMIGMIAMSSLFNFIGSATNAVFAMPWYWHLVVGGFAIGMLFMATDLVSASFTTSATMVRRTDRCDVRINPRGQSGLPRRHDVGDSVCQPVCPIFDYFVAQANIKRRKARRSAKKFDKDSFSGIADYVLAVSLICSVIVAYGGRRLETHPRETKPKTNKAIS